MSKMVEDDVAVLLDNMVDKVSKSAEAGVNEVPDNISAQGHETLPLEASVEEGRKESEHAAASLQGLHITESNRSLVEKLQEMTRDELVQKYQSELDKRIELIKQNYHFQHKIAAYFKSKKPYDSYGQLEYEKVSNQELENRLQKYLSRYEELTKKLETDKIQQQKEIAALTEAYQTSKQSVEEIYETFMKTKRDAMIKACNYQSGKTLKVQEIDDLLSAERQLDSAISVQLLKNIQLKMEVKELEEKMKSKDDIGGEELQHVDGEQLRVDNQTLNEKVEEKKEEVAKLRFRYQQILITMSHMKEKLRFMTRNRSELMKEQEECKTKLTEMRSLLAGRRQERSSRRKQKDENTKQAGLLNYRDLLFDYEEKQHRVEELQQHVDKLNVKCQSFKKQEVSYKKKEVPVKSKDQALNNQLPRIQHLMRDVKKNNK